MSPYPSITEKQDPDYTRISKGTESVPGEPAREGRPARPVEPAAPPIPVSNYVVPGAPADQRYENLWSGLGKVIEAGAVGGYTAIKSDLEAKLRDTYRAVQENEFGVGPATDLAGNRVPPTSATGDSVNSDGTTSILAGSGKSQGRGLPPGAQGLISKMDGFNKLHQSGMMSNSYYLGVMNATMKSFKANYPGFEKEVEDFTKDVLGINPANALRQSLMHDADARAKALSTSATAEIKEVMQYVDKGHLPATFVEDYQKSDPVTRSALLWDARKLAGVREAAEGDQKRRQAERVDNMQSAEHKADMDHKISARDYVHHVMNDETMGLKNNTVLTQWKSGITPDAEGHIALLATVRNTEERLMKGLSDLEKGTDPVTGKDIKYPPVGDVKGGSINTFLSKEKIEANRTAVMAPFEVYKKLVGAKEYGLAAQYAENVKFLEDTTGKAFVQKFPDFLKIGVMTKYGGPNWFNLAITHGGLEGEGAKYLKNLIKSINTFMTTDLGTKAVPDPQVKRLNAARSLFDSPNDRRDITQTNIDTSIRILTGGDSQAAIQTAKSVYHPDNNIFELVSKDHDSANYSQVYQKYTSPAIRDALLKASKESTEGQVAWNMFQTWAGNYFGTATKPDFTFIGTVQSSGSTKFTIEYNPETRRIDFDRLPTRFERTPGGAATGRVTSEELPYIHGVRQAIDRVNVHLTNLASIAEKGNRDVDKTITDIFVALAVPMKRKQKASGVTEGGESKEGYTLQFAPVAEEATAAAFIRNPALAYDVIKSKDLSPKMTQNVVPIPKSVYQNNDWDQFEATVDKYIKDKNLQEGDIFRTDDPDGSKFYRYNGKDSGGRKDWQEIKPPVDDKISKKNQFAPTESPPLVPSPWPMPPKPLEGKLAGSPYIPGTKTIDTRQYEIIDKQTGGVVGKAKGLSRAKTAVDKRDNAYGSYRYRHRLIQQDPGGESEPLQ